MNVNSGQTFTVGQSQLLFDGTARFYQWYIQDNSVQGSGQNATASATNPDGWNVVYDPAAQVFTVTVSPQLYYQGKSFHAGFIDGNAPSNEFWISNDFVVNAASGTSGGAASNLLPAGSTRVFIVNGFDEPSQVYSAPGADEPWEITFTDPVSHAVSIVATSQKPSGWAVSRVGVKIYVHCPPGTVVSKGYEAKIEVQTFF